MKKIPTIFERDWNGDRSRVVDKINPAAQWVFDGEGVPTQKLDGTCAMVRDGKLFKRREIKQEELLQRPPSGFELVDADPQTSKCIGWIPVGDGPEDKWFREAFQPGLADGTYELVGPKVQGNPEGETEHRLVAHRDPILAFRANPRTYEEIEAIFHKMPTVEGIVWHHPDGRMAKIKLRDFGIKRVSEAA
jgi:hypothetical protein